MPHTKSRSRRSSHTSTRATPRPRGPNARATSSITRRGAASRACCGRPPSKPPPAVAIPAPIAATARHLIGGRDADRKRALDVMQELQPRPEILAVIERWLQPAIAITGDTALASFDPWLGRLAAGELVALEPTLVALRRPALFARDRRPGGRVACRGRDGAAHRRATVRGRRARRRDLRRDRRCADRAATAISRSQDRRRRRRRRDRGPHAYAARRDRHGDRRTRRGPRDRSRGIRRCRPPRPRARARPIRDARRLARIESPRCVVATTSASPRRSTSRAPSARHVVGNRHDFALWTQGWVG